MYCYNVHDRKSFQSLINTYLPRSIATGLVAVTGVVTPTPASSDTTTPVAVDSKRDGDDEDKDDEHDDDRALAKSFTAPATSAKGIAFKPHWVRILVGLQIDRNNESPPYVLYYLI
jgi:hypothetical protein